MGEILLIGLQADTTSGMQLRELADWVIKPAILSTGGVSQVTIIGGEYKEYQILADPVKMGAFGVSMADLEAVGKTFSTNSEGGVIRDFGNEFALRGMARTADLEELGATLIKRNNGAPVRLDDVARVQIGSAVKMGTASQNASPAVILAVAKQPNINTLRVTEKIETNLEEIRKSLPSDVRLDTHIFRQADFIQTSVNNVGRALLEGALFVILILFLFLGSFRTTVISVLAIPISLLGSMIVLYLMGLDINTMTLGGMCIAIGSLVDDAIIDVENVYKRLRQNHAFPPEQRRDAFSVVFEASKEIRSSIINATFIVMVSFVPLFFLSGMEGRLLKPLGIAYLVAMTLTPLLCKMMLSDEGYMSRNEKDSFLSRKLLGWYRSSLEWVLRHRKTVLGATAALFVGAVVVFLMMGRSFLPDFNEGSAVISAVTAPGVSLDVSDDPGNLMERELMKIPEVTGTARRTGRGELDEHAQSVNSAELDVRFTLKDRSREEVFNDIRQALAGVPGVAVTAGQPLGHRIDHMLSGTRANLAIKLFGTDLGKMQMIGNQIKTAVEGIEGLVDVTVEQQAQTPQIQIKAKREALAAYGITVEDFNRFVALAFSGEKISDIYEGQRSFPLVVRLDGYYTGSMEGLRDALIDTPDGGKVPLETVAEIVSTSGPGTITRENVQRKQVVSANLSGRDIGSVVEDVQKVIARGIPLPEGYRVEYGGQFESARSASRTLLIATRNGILLISRYQHLSEAGLPLEQVVREGSADRLNPILMTALTSALALIPLVLGADKPGNEIQSPMAMVVLGGLLTSTLLNIYMIPLIYSWFAKRRTK